MAHVKKSCVHKNSAISSTCEKRTTGLTATDLETMHLRSPTVSVMVMGERMLCNRQVQLAARFAQNFAIVFVKPWFCTKFFAVWALFQYCVL